MTLSITGTGAAAPAARTIVAAAPAAVREDVKALGKALRGGDLPAARAAYVDLVKQAPEDAQLQPGSPFAALGKALAKGDMDAAKTAFAAALRGAAGQSPPIKVDAPISLAPTVSSTGGSAGGTLNAVA